MTYKDILNVSDDELSIDSSHIKKYGIIDATIDHLGRDRIYKNIDEEQAKLKIEMYDEIAKRIRKFIELLDTKLKVQIVVKNNIYLIKDMYMDENTQLLKNIVLKLLDNN